MSLFCGPVVLNRRQKQLQLLRIRQREAKKRQCQAPPEGSYRHKASAIKRCAGDVLAPVSSCGQWLLRPFIPELLGSQSHHLSQWSLPSFLHSGFGVPKMITVNNFCACLGIPFLWRVARLLPHCHCSPWRSTFSPRFLFHFFYLCFNVPSIYTNTYSYMLACMRMHTCLSFMQKLI